MIPKIDNSAPSFQANMKMSRKVPKEIRRLISNCKDVLPDKYTIRVKNNWIVDSISDNGEPTKRGHFDVLVSEKLNFFKKKKLESKSYCWEEYRNEDKNNFLDIAVRIHEQINNLYYKLNLNK